MDRFESRMTPRLLAESEKGVLPRVTESGRETVEGFKEDEKGKRRASVLSSLIVVKFKLIFGYPLFMSSVHALSSLVRLVTSLRGADFWSCVSSAKSWWFTEWLAMISERGVVYRTNRTGPQYWALRHTVLELWWWRRRVIDWSGQISVREIWLKPLECSRLNAKIRVQAGEENLVVNCVKNCRKIQQKKNRNVVIVQSGENIIYHTYRNGLCDMSCSIGWLKGVAEVVFLEIGEKFVENDFFKSFRQKWKVRNGAVVFKRFLSGDGFFNRGLTMAIFGSRGTMSVVRDVLMMFVMVGKRMSRFS